MSFLTYPGSPQKGVEHEVTLAKADMFGASPALGNESFIGSTRRTVGGLTCGQGIKVYGTKLKRAIVDLKTPIGEQKTQIDFDLTQDFPKGVVAVSEKARSNFHINQVILVDKDEDTVSVTRNGITNAASNDVTFV